MEFAKEEEKILELWKELDAFAECLRQSAKRPRFTFYDGPPFATGLPHFGHILAGTIKDIIPRWKHQHGYHVERRFGWDTHGLPVEYEIDKTLGIKGPDDVAKMGIAAYNGECRKIVMRYATEWKQIIGRLGRWIDFDNDYKTLYPWYMESIWWVFKQLWDKGLIYKGFRVMPYSTGCTTPLSNFESTQNYKDVTDPAVIISFPLDDEPDVSMIAWTTTPWTLPSNLALCVHPDLDYVRVRERTSDKVYILMEARLCALFSAEDEYEVLEKYKGADLKNKGYKPLFDYFGHLKQEGAFRILCDTYVTQESGTGVVHQAPYHGEDDNRVCMAAGVIKKGQEIVCPIDASGKFVDPVTDFKGQYVKDADKNIMKKLKDLGRLVNQGQVKHSYPFCWRSETPLLYRAVSSWFMRVDHMNSKLLEKNDETYWVPESIREGRFANWLKDARDWNLSRNRYWGTPIPVWMSEDGEESVCVGSIAELEKLSGVKIEDLHRESVDPITIPSKRPGHPPLKRITEVFDCWFESGSMPYAQQHYPFENKKEFDDLFPADFCAEGTDQTRGWFYTLLVLSTALFDKPPFKNLIVNGLVLASDGTKMSKKKKNYPDPLIVVNKYGADALRLYLINSPVVKAESLRFKEDGVKDILKDVFLPWYNAYKFLLQNIDYYNDGDQTKFLWSESTSYGQSDNVMDKWIISFTQSLLLFVKEEMAAYRLYTVLPRLMKFIDNLTNWYVRTNRKRLKGEGNSSQDCRAALDTLFSVVYTMVRVFAPFTPFLTEHMYQGLKHLVDWSKDDQTKSEKERASVHYLMIPKPREDLINEDIERSVDGMQKVVELGRVIRDRETMPLKYPLPELVLIHKDQKCLDDVHTLQGYVLDELNVKKLTLSRDKEKYGVKLRAEPDHKTLGARLKGAFKEVTKEIKGLSDKQVSEFVRDGSIDVLGNKLGPEDLRIMYTFEGNAEKYKAHSDQDILVLVDCTPDQSMMDEGIAREVVNRVQKLRKKAKLQPKDDVCVQYTLTPPGHDLGRIIKEHQEYIESTTKNVMTLEPQNGEVVTEEEYELKGAKMILKITKVQSSSSVSKSVVTLENFGQPGVPYVNVVSDENCGVVLLENPVGKNKLNSLAQVQEQIQLLFVNKKSSVEVFMDSNCVTKVNNSTNVQDLNGKTLYLSPSVGGGKNAEVKGSCCPFININHGNTRGCFLVENPKGCSNGESAQDVLDIVFGKKNVQKLDNTLIEKVQWSKVVGKTLNAA